MWDEELAVMSQTWAQQCTFGHDVNRNVRKYLKMMKPAWNEYNMMQHFQLVSPLAKTLLLKCQPLRIKVLVGQIRSTTDGTRKWLTRTDLTSIVSRKTIRQMKFVLLHLFFLELNSSNPRGTIGHYTQVVWAESYAIGCGIMRYNDTTFQPSFPYKQLYVCDYGPAGNYFGRPIYKVGDAASTCPIGTSALDGLCAKASNTTN